MSWQEDGLHAMLNCKTPAHVFSVLEEETVRLGMQTTAWGIKLPLPIEDDRFVLMNNYSPAWQARYADQGYLSVDPTVQHGLTSVLPIVWSDCDLRAAPHFWEDARSYGLCEGIAQSVWDRQGCCSMLSLSRDSIKLSQSELMDKMPKISWLSQVAHTAMTRHILPRDIPETAVDLSLREKEILKLTATGMTSQEIADRINLSKRGVDFHVENARAKLGAANRTDAAVRAIVLRLM